MKYFTNMIDMYTSEQSQAKTITCLQGADNKHASLLTKQKHKASPHG